jgi:hypothetical protein
MLFSAGRVLCYQIPTLGTSLFGILDQKIISGVVAGLTA